MQRPTADFENTVIQSDILSRCTFWFPGNTSIGPVLVGIVLTVFAVILAIKKMLLLINFDGKTILQRTLK